MSGLAGPQIQDFQIGAWCRTQDGTGRPEAVALTLTVSGLGDLVLRLKSPQRVDEICKLLQDSKKEVWPDTISDGQHQHGK